MTDSKTTKHHRSFSIVGAVVTLGIVYGDLRSNYPSLHKHDIAADFKFILIHRVFTLNQIRRFGEKLSLSIYNIIKHLGISDIKAYNLETSNVLVESVPLIVDTRCKLKIKRVIN